ncbi:Uncharacterised protein [Mycobacteroides abscessus subsp. abscessus]|uniref:hypothetical protein n=1 Tax=Mycobacteroides abscessus TaxID=36809 RepID=UPI00092A24F8|nr:hypothetical protein [Mycobacteroides abscessus]SIF60740.1 Uncharacterised protein [Mycobacteroides abscessus subsp. abscessus]
MTTESTATCPGCPNCLLTQHISTVAAALDPDRLANRVRAELRSWAADDIDPEVIHFGDGRELAVAVSGREVWDGLWTRTADQQMRLALIHLAAALAAGARV